MPVSSQDRELYIGKRKKTDRQGSVLGYCMGMVVLV